jgi:arylsulfatase A-like enzyme
MLRTAILGLVVLGACGGKVEQPNVLVVTIDTLRPDAIGKGRATPAFDRFFTEATRFERARTVAPLTLPAHVSMFTGLLAARHAVHDNVTEPLPSRAERGFPLLAEDLREGGYGTAAFVASGVLGPPTGLASGFDVFECSEGGGEPGTGLHYVPAEERIQGAIDWMRKASREKPWFVWVHLCDPHAPYHPFAGDQVRPGSREGDSPAALYAGEVRRTDAALEKLLAAAGPETVVVLASDHGEAFQEHEEWSHGVLCYGTTIDAVLAVRASGFRRGAVDTGLRSVADIAPTLRRICGLPVPDMDGRDLRGPPHETLVAESLFAWRAYDWAQCFSVTDGEFSLVESGGRLEFYDRRADPHETRPLPLSDPAYEKLDRALERFRARSSSMYEGDAFASVPAYGQLRRRVSGYLARHENARLPDPRTHIRAWLSVETVPLMIRMGVDRGDAAQIKQALLLLADLERETPNSPRIPHYRAEALRALADLTGDQSCLVQAAWAEVEAIERGYVVRQTVLPAIRSALDAKEPDALRALLRILDRSGAKLDPETTWALSDAAVKLGLGAEDTALGMRGR